MSNRKNMFLNKIWRNWKKLWENFFKFLFSLNVQFSYNERYAIDKKPFQTSFSQLWKNVLKKILLSIDNMIYHSTQSDDYLRHLILRVRKN